MAEYYYVEWFLERPSLIDTKQNDNVAIVIIGLSIKYLGN